MSVVVPAVPVAVPPCDPTMGGRGFASGLRTAAIGMSDCGDLMRANAAPAEWSGDASEVAHHTMTSTATALEGAVAALTAGAAAADRFLDRLERLITRHSDLQERRQHLAMQQHSLADRAAEYDVATEEAGLQDECASLGRRIAAFDRDVTTWQDDLTHAEDALVAALGAADTVAEGGTLAAKAPDVRALRRQLAEHRDDPAAMNAWWTSLSRSEREALKASDPELVGNSDGIPIADRDEANRANLSEDWNTLHQVEGDGELTSDDEDRIAQLQEVHDTLEQNEGVIDPSTGQDVEAFLMMYAPGAAFGDGAIAVAFGNPETADHTSVNVPGFGSRLDNFSGVAGDALNVFENASAQGNGSVASIAWLGYNAPDPQFSDPLQIADMTNVGNELAAGAGAREFSRFIDGLRATDQGGPSHLTAIGHSYGSTLVAKASGDGLAVDDTLLVGSPGAGAGNDHASDLSGRVWVGASDDDYVSHLGNPTVAGLGDDPVGEDFGGRRFRVDTQEDFSLTKDGLAGGTENHTSYFDDRQDLRNEGRDASEDSASLQNIGHVVSGTTDEVDLVDGRTENTGEWLARETGETTLETGVDLGASAYEHGRDAYELGKDVLSVVPHGLPDPVWRW